MSFLAPRVRFDWSKNCRDAFDTEGGIGHKLEVLWPQPGALRDSCEHPGTNLFMVVKGEYEIRPTGSGKRPVGAGLPLNGPANPKKRWKDASGANT